MLGGGSRVPRLQVRFEGVAVCTFFLSCRSRLGSCRLPSLHGPPPTASFFTQQQASLSDALGGRALDCHLDADEAVVLSAPSQLLITNHTQTRALLIHRRPCPTRWAAAPWTATWMLTRRLCWAARCLPPTCRPPSACASE